MTSGGIIIQKTANKKPTKKRPYQIDFTQFSKTFFCWFHTYYLITTRFRINNAKISCVIILLSNRTLSALKRPVYKEFQKIFIIQTQSLPVVSPVQSYITLFTCFTSFTILLVVLPMTSHGISALSAVMKSVVVTARSAMA